MIGKSHNIQYTPCFTKKGIIIFINLVDTGRNTNYMVT